MRDLILAIQFLTRLPTPQVNNFAREYLSRTAPWFPMVGLIVGGFVVASMSVMKPFDSWLGALAGLIMWTWITGALHLDGLADLADALGASHRNPQRFLEVMHDPHVGTFGVVALMMSLISKLVLLQLLISHHLAYWYAVPLTCAWSRLGAIAWSASLPSLHSGSGETFAWHINKNMIVILATALLVITAALFPALVIAPALLFIWWLFLRYRVGGMTGDCLGAGIEFSECVMLMITACMPAISIGWLSP